MTHKAAEVGQGIWVAGKVPFLDLGAHYMGVLNLKHFSELYTCAMCSFLHA